MRILCNFLVISVILRITRCDSIRVDGFFEDGDGSAVRTFRHTMDKLKLPLMARKIDLTYFSTRVNYGDSFDVSKKVCDAVSRGSKVIFGIHSRSSSDFINSLCDQLSIPHIQMYWEPCDVVTNTKNPNRNSMTLNLHPLYSSIALKHRELVKKWQWKNIAVLYENNDGLIRLQDVLKLSHLPDSTVLTYKIDQNPTNMKKIFTALKDSWINHIVIDCHYTRVKDILNQAKTEKVLTEYYHFHFTTLDLGVVDLSDFAGYRANITSLRLVNPNDPQVSQMTFDWKTELFSDNAINSPLDRKHKIMPTESALMYDAVDVFGKALIKMVENTPPPFMFDQRLACNLSNTWDQGAQLFRHMKTLKFKGLTGRVEFSEFNERTAFMLNVTKVINGDLKQIGIWDPENSLILDKMEQTDLGNINLTIVTVEDPPYVIINENGQYDGFCIDILKNMSQRRNFTYHIILGNFGNCNESGCTGLYKTLVDKKADMAVGGFTITSARDKYVDFTKPFWNLGITILFRKSKPEQPHLFSFLHPFHRDVWIYTIAIYLAVSFMFFAIARLTPYEWCNPYPCEPSADIVENQFSVLNSMWLTIGSFLQQGCELSPRTVSTRIVAGVWWFFTLIIISSYTANLAAFLTAGRMKSPISNAADLAKQEEIKYGTFRGGATSTFFKNSQLPLYQRMHAFMKKTPSAFVGSNSEGEQRVLEGGYAYFAESTTVEYLKQRNCELMEIGQWLDSKGYGFPLPRGSIYRDMISSEIIYMQDYQIMRHLYNKWWTEYNITTPCSPEKKKADASLSVSNVGGVFVVLVIVTILSVFVAFIEFIWYFYTEGDRKEPLFTKMRKEIIFALKVFGPSSRVMNRKGNDGITDNGHTNNYVT